MVDEKYLQMSITIRRTYLKLINNLDLYRSRALQISERLEADPCIFKKTAVNEVKEVMREQHTFISLNAADLFILVLKSK